MADRRIKLMLAIDGLGLGGAEIVLRELARHLDRNQFDVCICCTKGFGGEVAAQLLREGFDVFVLPGQSKERADYLTALKFRSAVKERGIDIVHTHAAPALFDAAPCRLTMRRLRVVHTFHYGNYPYDSWRHHLLEALSVRAVDRLVAVGLEQRRKILATYGLQDSRVRVIWNGLQEPAALSKTRFREEVGTGDRLLIGTIAKLIEQKGLEDLLSVARRCHDNGYAMQFVIVGEGHLRSALEQRRRELGLEDVVKLTGWIDNAAAQVLPAFDVFFQPSRWEAMSIAILEAMANAKAIVATRVGDNPHVLEGGVSGILVESGDIEGMTRALASVRDVDARDKLGRAALARFRQRFTVEHMVGEYEQIYREIVV